MQYTVRNIPRELDRALRARARREHKSLNEIAIEAMAAAMGLAERPVKHRDLGDIVGTWREDPDTEAALADQRQLDNDSWR
jgi:plasmid stability protein